MRHVAWLTAAQSDAKDKPLGSRLEAIKDDGGQAEYPPSPLCEYMAGYLWNAGPTMPGSTGNVPLSHGEIKAWQYNTGTELTAWEAQTLRHLSQEYLAQSQAAKEPDCPAPWTLEINDEARADVSKKVQNAFKTLMSTRPKK